MAGYWPRSFFPSLWTSSRSINTQKKTLANIQPSWPHTWSITHIYYKCVVIARVLLTAFTSFSFLFSSFLRIPVFARLQRLLASAIFLCFVLEVDCGCNVRGSLNNSCDPVTRQCFCKVRVTHTVRMYVEGRSLDYLLVNLIITSIQTIRPAFKAASTLDQ